MKIIVDGDGCAGRHIIERVAKSFNIPLLIFCDIHHMISSDYAEVRLVDSGFKVLICMLSIIVAVVISL